MSPESIGPIPGEYDLPDNPEQVSGAFWSLWGEKAGFSREQFDSLWKAAEAQYTDELPWHNFQHAQRVLWDAMCLADIYDAHNPDDKVNRRALVVAALFHDAGFHEDFMEEQFESKEAYSAFILGTLAGQHGLELEDLAIGQQAILSTQVDATPVSIEDKILGRADLMNVSGDYETSVSPATERLLREAQMLGGEIKSLAFKRHAIRSIASYLTRDLSLGRFEDRRAWAKRPVSNLWRMIVETSEEEDLPVARFVSLLGSTAVIKLVREHFSHHD